MSNRVRVFVRHVTYNLRGGFLVRPLLIALTLGATGATFSALEEAVPLLGAWVPTVLFPSHADAQVAQVILVCIAGSMMTVVSIVFAILLMTLTLASNQFSPRIIVNFARDRVTQQTLGIFLGTFTYCVAALPAARTVPEPFSPVATVLGAMLLALACVAWLLFFIHHISQAISVSYIVDTIARETEAVIDQIMPQPIRRSRMPESDLPSSTSREAPVLSGMSGYIRFVDGVRLIFLAKEYRIALRVLRRVGHFVPVGVPLLTISKGERLTEEMEANLREAFDLGPTRTLEQDVEFGILQIVDIALKAISPAVNDPSTAINCVDQLSRILIRFASREPMSTLFYDPPGVLRVHIPWLDFDRLIGSAFEQIRLYARTDVAVNLRLLRALTDIASTTTIPEYHWALAAQGRRVFTGCASSLDEDQTAELRLRLTALENLTAPSLPLQL
ncbi:MAG: DUF2254 domain-containing protein [Cytophagales bacterium]|nr:DUF2254 domain-containing protein [Armatimonadota bacterium]